MEYKYNKDLIKESLSIEQVFDYVTELGGEPIMKGNMFISKTICHNYKGEGSYKLYYYDNTKLFKCYTDCGDIFDIFELTSKVKTLETGQEYTLYDSLILVASYFGFSPDIQNINKQELEDWKIFNNYDRIQQVETKNKDIILKEYNPIILTRFNYNVKIQPWLDEGISQDILNKSIIGFYPGGDQITIPHFDENNRLIGVRGRTLIKETSEVYGKYMPLKINNQFYTHPLGMNLYNFNNSKENIKRMKKAIIFEGEKSPLLYRSYFGIENDITVACCGSSLSSYQMQLLIKNNVEEIIIAFDRQFQEINDKEFQRLKRKLLQIGSKYKSYVNISFIFDKNMITDYKDSPIDKGPDNFLQLFKDRIIY